jgi:putative tryptophan/tyrosine transport system substrate-binding protein
VGRGRPARPAAPTTRCNDVARSRVASIASVALAGTNIANPGDAPSALAALPHQAGTVLVSSRDAFFYSHRATIAALAGRHAVPAIFDDRDYVDAGGLGAPSRAIARELAAGVVVDADRRSAAVR